MENRRIDRAQLDRTDPGAPDGVAGPVKGLFYGDGGQFVAQLFEMVVGFIWAWGIAWVIFTIAKRYMKIRVSDEAEIQGLDMPEFGAVCYPDFVLHNAPAGHITAGGSEVNETDEVDARR